MRSRVDRGGDLRFGEFVGVQLAHVAEEEDEDAHALEACKEREEAEPEHGDGREAGRAGHVRDVQRAEAIAGGEHGEYDDKAATSDDDCPQEDGK